MTDPVSVTRCRSPRAYFLASAVALIALKLWLVAAQAIQAIGFASHDDALFINRTAALLAGDWLGAYDQYTLAHGPLYPFFITGAYLLHIPLFTAQHLLSIAGCIAVVLALRPLVANGFVRLLLFTVLLFNPVTYDGIVHARVLRQNLLPGLSLLIIAGFIGLHARRRMPLRRLWPWSLLAGFALGAFWLTRNESVWMAPALGLLFTTTACLIWREGRADRDARMAVLALPGVMCAAALTLVATINWRQYGVFTTTEFKQVDFNAAYGALMRPEPAQWRRFIPVPRETRERLYPLSPAFAELKPHLEGEVGLAWAHVSSGFTGIPAAEREIGAGWFMWTLRDAAIKAGHGRSGADVAAYYRRLAQEINDACERGLLKAGPQRSGFIPPLHPEHRAPFLKSATAALKMVLTFDQMSARVAPSEGSDAELALFGKLTRSRLSPPKDGREPRTPPVWRQETRLAALDAIRRGYAVTLPWAGAASLLALLASLVLAVRRRRVPYFGVAAIGMAGSILALVLIVALIDSTSFPALTTGYLSGSYGCWLLFAFFGWLALAEVRQPTEAGNSRASSQLLESTKQRAK